MRRFFFLLALALMAGSVRGETGFTGALTPEEQAAAGLDKLTPAERATLDALVQRYKAGEIKAVNDAAEKKVAEVQAEAKKEKEKVVKEERSKSYVALLFGSGDTKNYTVETTMPGKFRLFQGHPIFRLENHQEWQATEAVEYFCSKELQDPKVKISPGMMGSFWLEIEGGPRVRVKPVRLNN